MIVAIIQARMNSSRLPGKMLMNVGGKSLIERVLSQIMASKKIDKIVVATTKSTEDKQLTKEVSRLGADIFLGDEDDVLDRFYKCAESLTLGEDDIIVRITGDCPFIDPNILDTVIEEFLNHECDYCSNIRPPSFPDGLDTEVFYFRVLEKTWNEASLKSEREHVTPYIWKNNNIFKIFNVENNEDFSHIRVTIDEEEDTILINEILNNIDHEIVSLKDILDLVEGDPDLFKINKKFRRNEGYIKSLREDR